MSDANHASLKRMMLHPYHALTPEMLAIEQAAHPVPWSAATFASMFGPRYRVIGLRVEGVLVGYSVAHLVPGEVTLMNIAVAPNQQGKGYGQHLMDELLQFVSDQDQQQKDALFLEVREHNTAAIRLYTRNHFIEIGRRPEYYPPALPGEARETAIVMRRMLTHTLGTGQEI